MNNPDFVLASDRNDFFKKSELNTVTRWVGGKIKHEHFGFGITGPDGLIQLRKKIAVFGHRYMTQICAGNDKPVRVNRIRGVGY